MKDPTLFSTTQWVSWLSATTLAGVTLSVFMFQNFQTKAETKEYKDSIENRLERIESKIDDLIKESARRK